MNDNIKAGADLHAGDGGYSEGTQEKYNEFVKGRNQSLGKARIQQLALEARLGPALLLHHWGKVDALTDSEQEALAQIEKFAELIVGECGVALSPMLRDMVSRGQAYNLIKEHFGVEE
jgi:hypothetical protein